MRLALFDLDNTLLSGDSDFEWAQFLMDKGILDSAVYAEKNEHFFTQYKEGTLDIHEFLDFQLSPLARHPRAQLDAWLAEFMTACVRPMISDKARKLVNEHLNNGDLCTMVTATNSFVTGPICREFGIAHLIATVAAQEGGQFTGKSRGTPSFREGKIARVESWLESLGFWWSNFERSYFYSDSMNDLPLLSRVSHPVAVDPDETLHQHAISANWRILRLRPANHSH